MTTLPTPAEVAEARAWFDADWRRATPGYMTSRDKVYATVLVRYALACGERAALADTTRDSGAAPAEQPREIGVLDVSGSAPLGAPASSNTPVPVSPSAVPDHELVPSLAYRQIASALGLRGDAQPSDVLEAIRIPSAVPAVSAGGAGRDLTAADVQDSLGEWSAFLHPDYAARIADRLNGIARPADTGTQATEQTTETHVEWLTIGTDEDGDVGAETFESGGAAERAAASWRRRGLTDVHVERHEVTTSRSVSPWSPVAVHDENGAQA